jgi:hypothetical protein
LRIGDDACALVMMLEHDGARHARHFQRASSRQYSNTMIQKIIILIAALACCAAPAAAERTVYSLDFNWKFLLNPDVCTNLSNVTFPKDLSNMQCNGLSQKPAPTALDCASACCASDSCQVWQFCPGGDAGCGSLSCWTGRVNQCVQVKGWQSRARDAVPPPPSRCDVECAHQQLGPFPLRLNLHSLSLSHA